MERVRLKKERVRLQAPTTGRVQGRVPNIANTPKTHRVRLGETPMRQDRPAPKRIPIAQALRDHPAGSFCSICGDRVHNTHGARAVVCWECTDRATRRGQE